MKRRISLEPEAIAVSDVAAVFPHIYQLPPEEGRQRLEEVQSFCYAACFG